VDIGIVFAMKMSRKKLKLKKINFEKNGNFYDFFSFSDSFTLFFREKDKKMDL